MEDRTSRCLINATTLHANKPILAQCRHVPPHCVRQLKFKTRITQSGLSLSARPWQFSWLKISVRVQGGEAPRKFLLKQQSAAYSGRSGASSGETLLIHSSCAGAEASNHGSFEHAALEANMKQIAVHRASAFGLRPAREFFSPRNRQSFPHGWELAAKAVIAATGQSPGDAGASAATVNSKRTWSFLPVVSVSAASAPLPSAICTMRLCINGRAMLVPSRYWPSERCCLHHRKNKVSSELFAEVVDEAHLLAPVCRASLLEANELFFLADIGAGKAMTSAEYASSASSILRRGIEPTGISDDDLHGGRSGCQWFHRSKDFPESTASRSILSLLY